VIWLGTGYKGARQDPVAVASGQRDFERAEDDVTMPAATARADRPHREPHLAADCRDLADAAAARTHGRQRADRGSAKAACPVYAVMRSLMMKFRGLLT
jgi:hypothetical protein